MSKGLKKYGGQNHHNGLNLKKNEKNLGKVYKSFVILTSQTLNLLTVHFKGFLILYSFYVNIALTSVLRHQNSLLVSNISMQLP